MKLIHCRTFTENFLNVKRLPLNFKDYKEYAEEENRYSFSRTLQGILFKKLAWAVSIYCLYKMLMV